MSGLLMAGSEVNAIEQRLMREPPATTSVARAASRPVMRLREVSERELSPGLLVSKIENTNSTTIPPA